MQACKSLRGAKNAQLRLRRKSDTHDGTKSIPELLPHHQECRGEPGPALLPNPSQREKGYAEHCHQLETMAEEVCSPEPISKTEVYS